MQPSAAAASFTQTISSAMYSRPANVPKPQSVPAITRSRSPTTDTAFSSRQAPMSARVLGKGRREWTLPLWKTTAAALRAWLAVRGRIAVTEVFVNARGEPLSRWASPIHSNCMQRPPFECASPPQQRSPTPWNRSFHHICGAARSSVNCSGAGNALHTTPIPRSGFVHGWDVAAAARRSWLQCHRHRNNRRSILPAMPSSRSTKTMMSSTSANVSAALKLDCAKFRR